MGTRIGVAVVGAGMAGQAHAYGYRNAPMHPDLAGIEVDLVAIVDPVEPLARSAATRFGFARTAATVDEILDDDGIQAVSLALPNDRYVEVIPRLLAAGKHVLAEKPLGRDAAEAFALATAAQAAGRTAAVGFSWRRLPAVEGIARLVQGGAIGPVWYVSGWFVSDYAATPQTPLSWRYDRAVAGGGALLDMGCHTVEAARYFFGKENRIKDVFAWGATMVHKDRTTGEDNAVLLLRLEDGRTSLTEASWTAKGGMELRNEVYGTMGRIVTDTSSTRIRAFIQQPAGYLMEKADADVGWVFPIPDEARVYGYHEEMRHFVESFVKGEQPREDFVDGYVVNSVLDAAYKSMQSGHWEAVHIDSKVTG